jgi:hypothetical protein
VTDRRLRRLDRDRNRKLAFGVTFECAARRRDIGIVATDRRADMALTSQHAVCGIKPYPAEARKPCFDPSMRRTLF